VHLYLDGACCEHSGTLLADGALRRVVGSGNHRGVGEGRMKNYRLLWFVRSCLFHVVFLLLAATCMPVAGRPTGWTDGLPYGIYRLLRSRWRCIHLPGYGRRGADALGREAARTEGLPVLFLASLSNARRAPASLPILLFTGRTARVAALCCLEFLWTCVAGLCPTSPYNICWVTTLLVAQLVLCAACLRSSYSSSAASPVSGSSGRACCSCGLRGRWTFYLSTSSGRTSLSSCAFSL